MSGCGGADPDRIAAPAQDNSARYDKPTGTPCWLAADQSLRPADAAAIPARGGAYVLVIALDRPLPRGGGLAPGLYAYAGSAWGPGGLRARIGRHLRRAKAMRWHIDRLTAYGRITTILALAGGDECALMDRLLAIAGTTVPVRGFGSSDCRNCPAHLALLPATIGRHPQGLRRWFRNVPIRAPRQTTAQRRTGERNTMIAIDVHTHMLNNEWLDRLVKHGGRYSVKKLKGQRVVHYDGAPFMTLMDGMFDYDLRIKTMNRNKVDMAIVSLTCPSVYWGGKRVSSATARMMNDDMAAQQTAWPDRIRFFATLPWQYPDAALKELARACDLGAVGVFVAANISGESLTSAKFAPIWDAIDKRGLPVLVHPSAPPGAGEMDVQRYNQIASVGFMFDTTLAISRMIHDGFLDRYKRLKLIASHAGGYLPYIVGRLDWCHKNMPPAREKIKRKPSSYLRRIYYDTVTFTPEALDLCIRVGGVDRVMYGSDYPHNIGDMKGCLARVDARRPAERKAMRGGNAMRIFKL
jgi:aminocarboxymuconate-semialdehyde decarboxylase